MVIFAQMPRSFFTLAILLLCYLVGIENALANQSKGLYLQIANKNIEITRKDIEEGQIFQTGPNFASVMLKLKPVSALKLTRFTTDAVGQQVLWIWDGRVVCLQTLDEPLGEYLNINHLTSFEADDFKKRQLDHG